jgi:DNA-binding transcriptional LysR family regulator
VSWERTAKAAAFSRDEFAAWSARIGEMNVRQVETFDVVMKVESISRAAELLNVTQPVVSRTISELEGSLGFSLFERIRNRIVPTPEAKRFHRDVASLYTGLDSLRSSAARIRDYGTGDIRLASLPVLGASLVPRALRLFHELHPNVTVNLMVLTSREVRDGVASGAFELGLAADEVDTVGVNHQPFSAARAVCAVPLGHPLARVDIVQPAHLDGVKLIGYVPEDRGGQRLKVALDESGIRPITVIETVNATTVCALVSEGIGIGFVTPYALAGVDQSRIVVKPFEPPVYSRSLLLLPIDRPKSLLVRAMIDCLMVSR